MLAMALLLHGGLLGGMGGEAAGVDGSGEGAWTLATPAEGFLAASGTGELAHLLHLCLFRAFPRGASFTRGKTHIHSGVYEIGQLPTEATATRRCSTLCWD